MKIDFLLKPAMFAGLLLACCTVVQAAEALTVNPLVLAAREAVLGKPAPAIMLTTIDGTIIDLGALYGRKAVYLKFWATWCIPCRVQMPHFESVYQQQGDELAVIALNVGFNDTLEEILEYRDELGIHMPIVVDDGSLAAAFNLRITPQHIVIGKDGLIKHIGNRADAELEAVLDRERKASGIPLQAAEALRANAPYLGAGDMLPAATLAIGSTAVTLSDSTAQGSVVVFMIPWCESYIGRLRPAQAQSCREVREQIEALQLEHPQLRWIGVAAGLWTLPDDLTAYAKEYQVNLPLTLDADGSLFRRFGVLRVPTVIVADATGKIVKRYEGYDRALATVLSEPSVRGAYNGN